MVAIAAWPPKTENRTYPIADNLLRGRHLPAKQFVASLNQRPQADQEDLLASTLLYTDLPAPFYQAFLSIQSGNTPFSVPKIMENKNVSVRSCFLHHPSFSQVSGPLHLDHWEKLGWQTKKAYEDWLDSSMLFAFSHCMHYCSAPRVFDADEVRNRDSSTQFHFKKIDENNLEKRTNILSVTGFEFRNYQGSISETLLPVQNHSSKTMEQILKIAAAQEVTDLILIPYGLGVFLPQAERPNKAIKEATYRGMIQALNDYKGPAIKIHLCGGPEFLDHLSTVINPRITFIPQKGVDAYVLANSIQDHGAPKTKALMINAADNDWTALLDNTKIPGQFSDNHNLFMPTADEYLALVTGFAYFSVQKLIHFFKEQFGNKISSFQKVEPLEPIQTLTTTAAEPNTTRFFQQPAVTQAPQPEPGPHSSLSQEDLTELDGLIRKLEREIKCFWPFPNKARKKVKVEGLKELISLCDTKEVDVAIAEICAQEKYKELRAGKISTRTADLLDKLLQRHPHINPGPS